MASGEGEREYRLRYVDDFDESHEHSVFVPVPIDVLHGRMTISEYAITAAIFGISVDFQAERTNALNALQALESLESPPELDVIGPVEGGFYVALVGRPED